jgi:hypothetical protein
MNRRIRVASLTPNPEFRAHIDFAREGQSIIYFLEGKDVAVLIPAVAFKAVQKILAIALGTEFPCWEVLTIPFSTVCDTRPIEPSRGRG